MKSIEEHYRAIAPKLTGYLVGSGSSLDDAAEIVQETFLRLWKMRASLADDDGAVSGLIYTIARNLRRDRLRHGRFEVFATGEADGEEKQLSPEQITPPPASTPGDDEYVRRRLSIAFSHLPPVLREAYLLFQVSELPVREVARQTGVSENLVKVRIFRAKQKLRQELADLAV